LIQARENFGIAHRPIRHLTSVLHHELAATGSAPHFIV
jgi:hypothetical protein